MIENRKTIISKEAERINRVQYMLDHWDELPERLSGRFEGIILAVADLVPKDKKTG